MQEIEVKVSKPYKITIGKSLNFGELISPFVKTNAVIIHDANLPKSFLEKLFQSFNTSEINFSSIAIEPHGEDIKTFTNFEKIATKLIEFEATRKTLLIAVGGGTVGDCIGFLASSFMRGVPFIQVPTTLLSMVDSSVGGKVAINLGHYKNCIGAFYQPEAVLIDISILESLPEIELISGYAEVIKYGFIESKSFFDYLISHAHTFIDYIKSRCLIKDIEEYLVKIIQQSCAIKAKVVMQDETETKNLREILNFGHTFGHAFESIYLGKLPHGIAVGIGIIYACKFSGIDTDAIIDHFKKIGLYTSIESFCTKNILPFPSVNEILQLMKKDKKNDGSKIKLILLENIGKTYIKEFDSQEVESFLKETLIDSN